MTEASAAAEAWFARARAAFDHGALQEAEHCLREALARQPDFVEALNLFAVLAMQFGNVRVALHLTRSSLVLAPGLAATVEQLGMVFAAAERPGVALPWVARSASLAPMNPSAFMTLATVQRDLGLDEAAVATLRRAIELEPGNHQTRLDLAELLMAGGNGVAAIAELDVVAAGAVAVPLQRHVAVARLAAEAMQGKAEMPVSVPARRLPAISIICCSIRPERFAAITAMYDRLLAGIDYELMGIHDARSLAEGYNRGIGRARGEIIVFCHDDIDLLQVDFADRLAAALDEHDLVGVCGSRYASGEIWGHAGVPHLAGQIVQQPDLAGPMVVHSWGAERITGGIEVLDGVFFACRRRLLDHVRFDAALFDGFHLYDLDFSFAAHLAGFSVGVTTELGLVHASNGRMDARWRSYADRFLAKYRGILRSPPPRDQSASIPPMTFTDPTAAARFMRALPDYLAARNLMPPPSPASESGAGRA